MKKVLLGIFIVLLLTACAQERVQYVKTDCRNCNSQYTVRKPIEIVYEEITYTTVYEPRTYAKTKRVTVPYKNCEKTYKKYCR